MDNKEGGKFFFIMEQRDASLASQTGEKNCFSFR